MPMCGRLRPDRRAEKICSRFSATATASTFPPRYNIAPTQPIAIVRAASRRAPVRAGALGSGSGLGRGPEAVLARSSMPAPKASRDKPAFKNAMRYRRCLVPASGFYEWRRGPGRAKQPFWLAPRGRRRDRLRRSVGDVVGSRRRRDRFRPASSPSTANATVAPIHDRMPVDHRPGRFRALADRRTGRGARPSEARAG